MKLRLAVILASISLLILILPVVYAASIDDAVQQQIQQQMKEGNIDYKTLTENIDPQQALEQLIKQNPEIKETIRRILIYFSIFIILMIIDLFLRGFAMWKAAKKNSKVWFWALLLINTLGILPLLYLIFSKRPSAEKLESQRESSKRR